MNKISFRELIGVPHVAFMGMSLEEIGVYRIRFDKAVGKRG
jgi:hypothetical protein